MKCPQCSELNVSDNAHFCRNCGYTVLEIVEVSEGEKVKTKSATSQTGFSKGLLLLIAGAGATILTSLFWDIGAPLEIFVRLLAVISFLVALIGILQIVLALRLFDFPAVNYLFELFNHRRTKKVFNQTEENANYEQNENLNQKFGALLQKFKPRKKYLERVMIKSAEEVIFLKAREIDWIEPTGNYLQIHKGKETHLLRETMSAIEAKLDPKQFVRIQRSTIVNVERIKKLHPLFRGEYEIVLLDDTRLTSSRSYRSNLQKVFGTEL